MSDAAGVSRSSHINPRSFTAGTVTGKEITVFIPCEMRQLVKADEIKFLALIFDLVLRMVQTAEINVRTAWKFPDMLTAVVSRLWKGDTVKSKTFVNQLR